jgi:hypothetical protein
MTGYAPLPPSGQRPMTQTQDFFVFITADPQLRGLSWLRTGENLPCLMDSRTWFVRFRTCIPLDHRSERQIARMIQRLLKNAMR